MTLHRWRGLLPLTVYAAATVFWLSSLIGRTASAIPGAGAGDNLTFVWNTWWLKQVLMAGQSMFWSPAEFVPFGTDLTLHTHTALPSAIAALLSFGGSVATGTNVVIALHLYLNFVTAYVLAQRITRSQSAAFLGGLVFGWCPYVASHLAGHFNLIAAWILPLTALALDNALDRAGRIRAIVFGVVLGGTVYVDYYYTVYAGVLVFVLLMARSFDISVRPRARLRWQYFALKAIAVLLAIDFCIVIAIALSGGTALNVGDVIISMRSTDNPVAAAGLLLLLASAVVFLPRCRLHMDRVALYSDVRRTALAIPATIVVVAPVLVSAARLWHRGDYVSQEYFWKSAPPGIDLATFFLGNPNGAVWGGLPSSLYQRFGINAVEQVAWIGPATLLLCLAAVRFGRGDRRWSRWCALGGVFMLWALGPYLVAFGDNLSILLPATLVRYLPIVANARIPARAIVVVYLSLAMVSALGFAALRARQRTGWALALLGILIVDSFPSTTPVFALKRPAIYDVLRQHGVPGATCELPLGLRDGFGETGIFDSRTLWYQTIHERPMTGGFVARLSPRLVGAYNAAPVLGSLLRLSSGKPLDHEVMPGREEAAAALRGYDIRFIVVNRDACPPDLLRYITLALPLRLLATDDGRDLYVVQEHP